MRIDVPPRAVVVACENPPYRMKSVGSVATRAR